MKSVIYSACLKGGLMRITSEEYREAQKNFIKMSFFLCSEKAFELETKPIKPRLKS